MVFLRAGAEQAQRPAQVAIGKAGGLSRLNLPAVQTSLSNLGAALTAQGRLAEAQPLVERGLSISRQHLGDRHPQVAVLRATLGEIRSAQEALADARRTSTASSSAVITDTARPPGSKSLKRASSGAGRALIT